MLSFENEMLPNKTHLQFLFVLKHLVVFVVIFTSHFGSFESDSISL